MTNSEKKAILIHEMQEAHDQFTEALAKINQEDLLRLKTWGDWSFKDMLAHITDWEVRNFSWYLAGLRGETPVTPDPDFDWEHMDELNHAIYLKHCDDPLDEVLAGFEQSWQETLRLVRDMPADHLYKKGKFAWLGEYLWADVMLGSTTHHYLEHLKDIRAWLDKNVEK
ncbi:MAG: ClbS/DfsB family four-helix bundle protein [Anaerolineaceae bacterium]|nr:ClbS/DfsB family four-helix bundle protein [Anaerolineaceae bacterium]